MIRNISGIQQIGIGVSNVQEAFTWYRKTFGMDIKVFEEAAEAALMLPYTGGKPQTRIAIFALNLRGGGGFEIWQYTSRVPQPPASRIQLGDLGLFITRIKSTDVKRSYKALKEKSVNVLSPLTRDPAGNDTFFVQDPFQNIFQVVSSSGWFWKGNELTGGVEGCMIGVSDMDRSKNFYSEILGYDTIVYEKEGKFSDLENLPGGTQEVKRVLLGHGKARSGSFSKLIGPTHIELVMTPGRKPEKIFRDRLWGDLGFIHLCFDITGMADMKKFCESKGHPFTADSSSSFDMGEAAGHFSYIEDPDGTLIEFVETHRIPIAKKIGWYLDLRKRNPEKPLPDWMLKAMVLNRVK